VLDFRRPGAAHAHLQTERLAALAAWADPLLISLLSMAAPKLPRVFGRGGAGGSSPQRAIEGARPARGASGFQGAVRIQVKPL
jgi:hypothetical protein